MPQRWQWQRGWWAGAQHRPSPNHGPRPAGVAVSLLVLHSISLPPGVFKGDAVQRLFLNQLDPDAHDSFRSLRGLQVSAHFFIRRSGRVMQFVSCEQRAWHAGVSRWRGRENCNDYSIGIELEGLEGGLFEPVQYQGLGGLIQLLRRRYPITEVVGHEDIAPGRKHDPGAGFDWRRVRSGTAWRLALRGKSGVEPSLAP
jgi:N-acetyl-anhydromuramoyl-L-alanine amidase